jgi:hypothetical protein
MKMPATATCLLVSILTTAAGCSSTDTTADETSSSDKVCVSVRTIDSFASISDKEIFVTARTNDSYVFTVMGVCQGLRSANAIGVADSMGRICGDGFGRVVFRDMGHKQSCRVKSIDPVADLAEAKALAASRKPGSDDS